MYSFPLLIILSIGNLEPSFAILIILSIRNLEPSFLILIIILCSRDILGISVGRRAFWERFFAL